MGISTVPPDRPLIIWEPSATPPAGYIKANGAVISRTAYAWLFGRIGITFGAGDGITTFSLPDLRGEFLRGLDDGRGVDAGRVIGTGQAQDTQPHNHYPQATTTAAGSGAPVAATLAAAGFSYVVGGSPALGSMASPTTSFGTTETRPRNIAGLYCIAYAP